MAWLWWLIAVLVIAWVVLQATAVTTSWLIHILLIVALILLVYNLFVGRRVMPPA